MKVLMVSLDKSLLSSQSLGDVLERMKVYAGLVASLTVLIPGPEEITQEFLGGRLKIIGSGGRWKFWRFIKSILLARKQAGNADIITAQDPFFAGCIGLLSARKRPLVVDVHGDFFGEVWRYLHRYFGFLLRRLAKFVLKRAAMVRVVNPQLEKDLVSFGIDKQKIQILPVPVDLGRFEQYDAQAVEKIRRKANGRPLLFYAGRLTVDKGVGDLIDALDILKKTVPDAKLIIAGSWPYGDPFHMKVRELKLEDSVQFAGEVGHKELSNYYQACDIFVLPSRHESFGRVILEAAMARKPVVAARTIGAQMLIKDKVTGFLVPAQDSAALSETLAEVWFNYEAASRAGAKLYEEVKVGYDYQHGVNSTVKLWQLAANKL